MPTRDSQLESDPLWYKDAIIYQVHVRSFFDSNDDGVGDFKGLTEKLDYIESLGVTALWLLPFYPSPLRDDGYDIADYLNVNREYGTMREFREFLRSAHRRGIRVITELVLNHTSSDHHWFQRSRHAKPNSKWRDMYVWSDTPDKYRDARIIFQDFESSNWAWDSEAQAYYWHRFYSHQPDLNFDSPVVHQQLFRVMDFWMRMGVDGVRLDAVPYLYEREGTNCENLSETHSFLKELRKHVDDTYTDKMLLAEANQWPEDAAAYFGEGDECHMAFHFPVMPRMFMAIHVEDSFPISDILSTTPDIPESCQWAMFLRNHDELTLEMVTDEERDYMYRVYARDPLTKINLGIRRRLAPLLGNNRRKIELMNILLFSFPGTPIIYYGDELGMGDNYYLGDRNGVRTPMQWTPDRNAGFSKANPQRLFLPVIIDPQHHYEALNVETQERNSSSMLWWMKRVIGMRKKYRSLSRGSFEMLTSDNSRVLAFARKHEDETILVIANLSRFAQVTRLDLSEFAGLIPEEVFSQNKFPQIRNEPYTLTLGPHSHYWLYLQTETAAISLEKEPGLVEISTRGEWQMLIRGKSKESLEQQLKIYLKRSRWFGAKTRGIRHVRIVEDAELNNGETDAILAFLKVSYMAGDPDLYLLPMTFAEGTGARHITEKYPGSVIAQVRTRSGEGILYDSSYNEDFQKALLSTITHHKKIKGHSGDFIVHSRKGLKRFMREREEGMKSWPMKVEQSNTSIVYDRELILKLYRHVDEGINPEYDISRYLTEKLHFSYTPGFAGAIEYRERGGEARTVAILQRFIENEGDAWAYTTNVVSGFYDRVLEKDYDCRPEELEHPSILEVDLTAIPTKLHDLIGGMYLDKAVLLGERTAEMHLALSSNSEDAAFRPEPFSLLYQRSLYQSLQSLVRRTMQTLQKSLGDIPEEWIKQAEGVIGSQQKILNRMQRMLKKKITATRIRIHGDYHLGQVLNTGKDFVIIDFEGEPARSIGERRLKHSPLKDVAGMIRSFHYAASVTMLKRVSARPEDEARLSCFVEPWYRYISGAFLHSYLEKANGASFIPEDREELQTLLQTYLLEKAVYELGYELNNRPDWVQIP
ncbi:MAG: maltose alpha-D-glucosyltransferase, partial [Candidatus Zixiibacteriota bacterium]